MMETTRKLCIAGALAFGVQAGCATEMSESDEPGLEEEQHYGSWVSGETIVRWNLNAVNITNGPALFMMRELAIVHVAMHDAVNAVDEQYETYALDEDAVSGRGADAALAAAAAAHDALVALHGDKRAQVDAMLQTDLARVRSSTTRQKSLSVGAAAANAILTMRANDGFNAAVTYNFGPVEPGVYQPVPPAGTNVAFPQWPNVTPFVMTSGSQFRPAGPVSLSSQTWADDYNEMRILGRIDSTVRTADQTHAARFWVENPQFASNTIARNVATRCDKGLWNTARAFALVNVGIMDASIATWDAKYYFSFWRPYTAVRGPDGASVDDGREDTPLDPTWLPLNNTPGHPEYPCGHCELSAAASVGLTAVYGSHTGFTITTAAANPPGSTRTYRNFDHQVDEASESRTWGGFHYRFSREDGKAAGYAIGNYILQNAFERD
jgi:hypothetical protein